MSHANFPVFLKPDKSVMPIAVFIDGNLIVPAVGVASVTKQEVRATEIKKNMSDQYVIN